MTPPAPLTISGPKHTRLLSSESLVSVIVCLWLVTGCFGLVGCTETNYQQNPRLSALPTSVTALNLMSVAVSSSPLSDTQEEVSENDVLGSTTADDVFVAKIIKAHLVLDFMRDGVTLCQKQVGCPDIRLKIHTHYQRDDWPFSCRSVQMRAEVIAPDGAIVFQGRTSFTDPIGRLGDYFGLSTDDLLSKSSQNIETAVFLALSKGQMGARP